MPVRPAMRLSHIRLTPRGVLVFDVEGWLCEVGLGQNGVGWCGMVLDGVGWCWIVQVGWGNEV